MHSLVVFISHMHAVWRKNCVEGGYEKKTKGASGVRHHHERIDVKMNGDARASVCGFRIAMPNMRHYHHSILEIDSCLPTFDAWWVRYTPKLYLYNMSRKWVFLRCEWLKCWRISFRMDWKLVMHIFVLDDVEIWQLMKFDTVTWEQH